MAAVEAADSTEIETFFYLFLAYQGVAIAEFLSSPFHLILYRTELGQSSPCVII